MKPLRVPNGAKPMTELQWKLGLAQHIRAKMKEERRNRWKVWRRR